MTQTLFLNATIIDCSQTEPRSGNVLIENGRIVDTNVSSSTQVIGQTIDLRGATLMPGLIDCHVHVVASTMDLTANAQLPDALAMLRSLPIMKGMLERGFTTVRDVGGAPYSLAQGIEEGHIVAPRLVVCGKALSRTGGHADNRPRHDIYDAKRWARNYGALGRVADGVEEVRFACRETLREGASFIKIMANGGVSSPTDPVAAQGYSTEEILTAVQEARDNGTYVSAHLYMPDAIERAVRAGVHSLEHCNNIDAPTARLAAAAGAVAVPTLVTYEALANDGARFGLPPVSIAKVADVRTRGMESLSIMQDAGLTMAFGTDLLGDAHDRQNEEFAIRARVLPSFDILASATTVAAALIGMKDQLGVVKEGAFADLLVINGNPAEDVSVLADPRNINLVMKEGRIFKNTISY
ncbi:peptidase M38 [Gluconobacter oxydans]|uniref:metal-dependent hydrolase family protein n=1 Tax=Gluconobacter thailandicus TaxID=257438 RepID=UPI0002998A00|nr:amidohydrolase family protein [Gluconobacter thailandicus]AFW02579.1 putative amidohydrolase [Gluconobacter oxydans H24]ANQ41935.1 peptidase M38 [Gluconobacter oxydans]